MEEELTEEEIETLEEMGYGAPQAEEKQNIFTFFKRVIFMKDTTRTGNLTNDELGIVTIPLRTNLELSLYAKKMGLLGVASYFKEKAHITSDSSLSREGFLDKLAVTQKREMESKTRRSNLPQKKGWFAKQQPQQPTDQYTN